MDKIIIKNTTSTKRFTFLGTELRVEGEIDYYVQSGVAFRIKGSLYEKSNDPSIDGAYVGNFTGDWGDDEFIYSMYGVKESNISRVSAVLSDLDNYIENVAQINEPETPVPTQEELLSRAKLQKIQAIDTYDSSAAVNSFTIDGTSMWLTREERTQIGESIDAYESMGETQMTKYFGGAAFTFPLVVWKQMLDALIVYASEALNVTESHKTAVNALTTIADVEAYDITTGYPQKLSFSTQTNE